MGDFFEGLMCVFIVCASICYFFSPMSVGDWRNEIWEFSFEGDIVDGNAVFFNDGEKKIVIVDNHHRETIFLDDDLEIVSPESATLKIVFTDDKFVVYN